MSSVMPSASNYAEQVLREEAERLRQINEKKSEEATYANASSMSEANFNQIHTKSAAKVNLNDEKDFPTLGNAKANAPVWTNSAAFVPAPKAKPVGSTSLGSSSSVRFLLPQEHQRKDANLSATVNSLCARLMKESGTTIEVSISSQTGAISFVVGGKPDSIKYIKRQLWSTLAQNGSIQFEVPEECLRFIIGPSGKVLKEIESVCAVRVKIPRGDEWTGSITVSGDFEGVAMARDRILSIVQERANKASIQMDIDRMLAPFLWETRLSGVSLDDLTESFSNVKINLIKSEDSAHLNLSGDREQIQNIQEKVSEALIRLRSSIKSVSTSVSKPLHRLLIGPKGTILHKLEEETGCGISVPSSKDASNEQVTIYGPEEKLLKGLSVLMERVKGLASEKIPMSEISFKLLQNVQKYRSELKVLTEANNITSSHLNSQDKCIEIDGNKDSVLEFISQFKALLAQLAEYTVCEALEVDQGYLKHIIGRKGQNLQQIQKDFNVEIIVEDDDETVSFIGKSKESVLSAKDYVNGIISSISDVLSVTLRIDSKYHGHLIGAKGSNLTKYLDKYPSVMINFPNEKDSNSVVIKGSRDEVEACQAELISQADSIRHELIMNSYTQSIRLDGEDKALLKSQRDCSFLTNFVRQNDCKLVFDLESSELTIQGLKKTVDSVLPLLKEQIDLIKDRDSLTFSVDPQYHGILIGAEGRNLKHLVQKYSVKIDFPRKSSSSVEASGDVEEEASEVSSDSIKITGPRKNISKARDELLDLLKYHLEHDHQDTLCVPAKYVASIIGKGGSSINSIKLESDCNVDFMPKSAVASENDEAQIKLHGTKKSIETAKKLINQLVSELADQLEISVSVSSSELLKSLLHGPFKREYRKLTGQFEGINFYPRDSVINVKGKKGVVEEAVAGLEELVKSIESKEMIEASVMVPSKVHGKILGTSGSNIKELIREFDCEIQVPRPGQAGPIKIVGKAGNVHKCEEKIKSYCIEERFFKFPSAAVKAEILAKFEMKEGEPIDGINWTSKSNIGITLTGEIDLVESFKERLQLEMSK